MRLLLFVFVVFALPTHAKFREKKDLKSPIPSDVSGLTIPNSHYVAISKGTIVRGMHPLGKEKELKRFGVTDVLIFKNETRDEVRREKAALKKLGYADDRIVEIPFLWDELPPFKDSCADTVRALKLMVEVAATEGRTLFFHCTVGEDRTGYLAGLFRVMSEGIKPLVVFQKELCENGYAGGDPDPSKEQVGVNAKIARGLTPLFFKMAALIEAKKLTAENLTPSACDEALATELATARGYLEEIPNCTASMKVPPVVLEELLKKQAPKEHR